MTTSQIIIFIIISLLFIIISFRCIYKFTYELPVNERGDYSLSMTGLLLIFGLLLTISMTVVISNNQNSEKLKNKCPELVKLENVYKLK